MIQLNPDPYAFNKVMSEVGKGKPLTCRDICEVFGWPAVELFLIMAGDSKEVIALLGELKEEIKKLNNELPIHPNRPI